MRRAERHHLKDNELQRWTLELRRAFDAQKREVTTGLVAILVIGVAVSAYLFWRGSVTSRAETALAEALAVQEARVSAPGGPAAPGGYPSELARLQAAVVRFKSVADAYPSTDAGVFARYQEAAGEAALGHLPVAVKAYQDVLQHSGSGIYTQMARLGLADAQGRSGQFDQAINTLRELTQRKDGPLPVDGILMELARTYRDAGKRTDEQQTLNRLVQEFPDSPFMSEARRELEALNKT
jgi:predicted negative regulator of RcsB-dependent stress response